MNVFGTELEATVRVLKYDPNDNFVYEELESVPQIDENKVRFSILVNIKQKDIINNGCIQVRLTHRCTEPGSAQEKLRSVHIADINLTPETDSTTRHIRNILRSDPWAVRQTFRINFASVPTEGPDDYALVLRVPSDNQKYRVLDCAYLRITDFIPHPNDLAR